MADKKSAPINSLTKGSYIIIDGAACKVVSLQTSKSGKHGHSKINLMAVGILDDKKRNLVAPGHSSVEVPMVEKKTAQVLSIKDNIANVMDSETFETFDLEIPEELKGQVVEGVSVLYWEILDTRIMKQLKGSEG